MVAGAGLAGLAGLLVGRWMADHVGRRPTAAVAMVGLAGFGALAYGGRGPRSSSVMSSESSRARSLHPRSGSLLAELFPTTVRASVAGWWVAAGVLGAVAGLVTFGVVADVGNRFAVAAVLTFLPAACFAALFWAGARDAREGARGPLAGRGCPCGHARRGVGWACRRWVARGVNDGRTGR